MRQKTTTPALHMQIDAEQRAIHGLRNRLPHPLLEQVLIDFFDDEEVVDAYLAIKLCETGRGEGMPPGCDGYTTIAVADAVAAAINTTTGMPPDDEDRQVLYAAAVMYPSGAFLMALPRKQREAQKDSRATSCTAGQLRTIQRSLAVAAPLIWLSYADPDLARKLAFLLDQLDTEQFVPVPAQWHALREALHRGQRRIPSVWEVIVP